MTAQKTQGSAKILTQLLVWGSLFLILYLLRSFSLLIFLTFVFAYILSHASENLRPSIPNRTARVVLLASTFLAILIGIGTFIVPNVRDQAELFAGQYPTYLATFDRQLIKWSNMYPQLDKLVPGISELRDQPDWTPKNSPTLALIQGLFEGDDETEGVSHLKESMKAMANVGGKILASGSAFLLSLLFSFLIVLDLPKLTANVRGLRESSLQFVYDEVADSLYDFGTVLGRALQAQLFIAIINTILTAAGVYFLGLGKQVAFLSLIVFLCSFVPVAGVFISSIPICLITLQTSGVQMMLFAIILITVIHMIETYILNPKIYGHHLHMNPVLVLSILTIGGKLFGVWGLVLGVPVCRYFFGHAIRRKHA